MDRIKTDKTRLTNQTTLTINQINTYISDIKEYSNGNLEDFKRRWKSFMNSMLQLYPNQNK